MSKSSSSGNLLSWIKQSVVSLVDPKKEARIEHNANILHGELTKLGRSFDLNKSPICDKVPSGELHAIKERLFKRYLTKAWTDHTISAEEASTLRWLGRALQLSDTTVAKLNGEFARDAFEKVFVTAIADGQLSNEEYAYLDRISKSAGSTVPQMFRAYFRDSAEGILRGIFASTIKDGRIDAEEWNRLWTTSSQLGVEKNELLSLISPQAHAFVEHILADAKADEQLTEDEEAVLAWLLQVFVLPRDFVSYANAEIHTLRIFRMIAEGKLPSLVGDVGVELRSGELVHHAEGAHYRLTKHLKSGPRVETHTGRCVVTDSRLIFSSTTKSVVTSLRSVLECRVMASGVELRTSGKGGGEYYFSHNPRLAARILRAALGRENQTLVERSLEPPTRHLPHEIRQRVWQKYGGLCAECRCDQYLEFDHVIPVAKGGSNSEANVQLLCRRCNLRKSDLI